MLKRYFVWCICLATLALSGRKAEACQPIRSKQDAAKSSRRLVRHYSNGKWGYFDETGKIILQPRFDFAYEFSDNGRALVKFGDKWGVIDATGNWVLAPQFDDARDFHESMAPVRLGDRWGYIDATGKVAIPPQFDFADDFYRALARVRLRGKWVIIGKKGSPVDEPQIDYTRDFPGGYARVWLNGRWCYLDTTGNIAVTPRFYVPVQSEFFEGLAGIKFNDKWGYIDKTGEWSTEPQEEWRELLRAEICCNEDGSVWGSYGIDSMRTLISFDSQFQGDFFDGLVMVRVKGKWGYVDTTGKIVIAPEYYGAGDFFEGRAPVLIEPDQEIANIRYIDKTGRIISAWEVDTTAAQSDVASEVFYKAGEQLNVLASSGLKLREAANSNAKILAIAAYGDQVAVLEDQAAATEFKIDGMAGRWILAKYGEITGYVFDGFLSRLPAPPENCAGLEQYVMEKLLGTGKREMIHINPIDGGSQAALEVQKCRYGVIWEFHHGWEAGSQTLIIPNIRLEEGTLIANLCTRDWLKDDSTITVDISIKKNEKHQVEITVRWQS